MDKIKATVIAVVSALMSWLGILAVPVFLLVGCNVVDYITGLFAAKYRTEDINSYKSIRGIVKKVCMWLLVVVGAGGTDDGTNVTNVGTTVDTTSIKAYV